MHNVLGYYGCDRAEMAQVGSEWPKWGQNGLSALDKYLMYLFDAQVVIKYYSTFEA